MQQWDSEGEGTSQKAEKKDRHSLGRKRVRRLFEETQQFMQFHETENKT